jgi:hypothetical protein
MIIVNLESYIKKKPVEEENKSDSIFCSSYNQSSANSVLILKYQTCIIYVMNIYLLSHWNERRP